MKIFMSGSDSFRGFLGVNNLDHRMGPHFPATNSGIVERSGYHTMGNSIADLERMKAILVIGSDLVDEQPIIFLRVRKAWRFRGLAVEVNAANSDRSKSPNRVSEFASVTLSHLPGDGNPRFSRDS